MERARLDEKDVAGMNGNIVAHLEQRVILNPGSEFLPCERAVHAVNEGSAFPGVHHHPHFGFAVFPFLTQRIVIIRMDLHGKVLFGVNELDEHGKIAERRAVRAEHGLTVPPRIFRQGETGARPVRNHAHAVLVAGELPAFRHFFEIRLLAVFPFQTVSAPEIILKGSLQFQRFHLTPLLFSCAVL